MDIQISASELRTALTRTQGVTDKKGSMPILSTVLLEASQTPEGGRLTVRAYDLEIGICSQHACEVKKEGAIAIPAKSLLDIAKALPENTARLKAGANNRMELTSGGAAFKLAGMAAEDFPAVPTPAAGAYEQVDCAAFLAVLESAAVCMSYDETRYNLNGVYFEATPDGVVMVGTDGHRMAVSHLNNDKRYGLPHDAAGVIVPRKAVQEISKLLAESVDTLSELAFTDNALTFRRPGVTYMSRLTDGQFPNYKQVIPEEGKKPVFAKRGALLEVLKRVMLMASDRSSSVSMELSTDKLVLASRDPECGEATDSVSVVYTGAPLTLALNGRYLMDSLGALNLDDVVLSITGDTDPIRVRAVGAEQCIYIQMPMRQ